MNRILLTLTCCLALVSAYAQDEPRIKLIGLEAGADVLLVEVSGDDNIRAEASYYSTAEKNIRGYGSKFYSGFKAEVRSRNNKFGFSAGLRYTRLNTTLGKGYYSYYSGSTSDFFYFMVKQSDNSIEYLRVEEITENSDYIGIPVSVSYSPFGEHLFTFYFKAGIEVSYRLGTTTTVTFVDPAMKQYNDDVVNELQDVGSVNAMFNTAGGFRIKASPRLTFSLEAGPSAFFTENNSRVVNTLGSFGGQLNVQFSF